MSNTFRFNGKSYNVDDVIHSGLKYRFINKNKPLTPKLLGKALGYSFLDTILKFVITFVGIFLFTLFIYNLIDFKLSVYGDLKTIGSSLDAQNILMAFVTSIACSVFMIFLIIPKLYDTMLILRHLSNILELRKSEINELITEESNFRVENNIEGETSWSFTQHDKLSLLRVILLEDINSSSISRRSNRSGNVLEHPELSQYLIVDQ